MKTSELIISATDGFPLGATLFGEPSQARGLVLVAGATAVPQRFYRGFAEYMAERDLAVLTVDYRGIGASRSGPLRGFEASMTVWAEKDLAAVLDWALEKGKTAVVGHSFGGQAFGLLSRANETLGLYTFGTGAGWHGHMPVSERPKVLLLWNVIGPITTAACGYLPGRRLGLGEDLPLGVYREWRAWCRHPNYFFGEKGNDFAQRFATIRVQVVAVNSTEDRWIPPRSAEALMVGYSGAPVELRAVRSRELGERAIGHMDYFRRDVGPRLWADTVSWVDERLRLQAA